MDTQPINLLDYEQLARDKLSKMIYDYFAGGADNGITLRENSTAFDRIHLLPRILVDVSKRDTSTTLLGNPIPSPIIVAPMALSGMANPLAEVAIARATTGIPMTVSTLSSMSLEDIAGVAGGPLWFQLYVYKDRGITRQLVERAEAAGYEALVLTVDVPVIGNRERDRRNSFKTPRRVTLKNLESFALDNVGDAANESAIAAYVASQIDPSLTWEDLDWLRSITRLPVVLKGVLRTDDAQRAYEHGAAAIVVSNHGGRQLDTTPAAVDVLPDLADAAGDKLEIIVDGGIRRGTDVLKAIALGAKAVMVGRPLLWGIAVNGEAGARHVLQILQTEFDNAMALCGCASISEITPDLIRE